jgi:uncharacterized RDD family membrane protein YckC
MNSVKLQTYYSKVKQRLWLSLPLIPIFSGITFIITIFSPMAWSVQGYIPLIGLLAISFGIICAYCTVIFIEECSTKFGDNIKK